jgi:hypothetical protein
MKKYFWKPSQDMYVKKLIKKKKLISRLNFIIKYLFKLVVQLYI